MRRIAVIGCSGAGKTRFATALAARTGLPVIHLDAEYWQPGWRRNEKDVWLARHAELIAREAWILDGNMTGTLEARLQRVDTVFWFDASTVASLFGVAQRTMRYFGRNRPDMAPGCPERIDRDFLKYVLEFRSVTRPRLVAALERAPARFTLHRFERRSHVRRYLRDAPHSGKIADAVV